MNNIKLLFKSLYAKLDKQMVEVVGRIDLVNNRLEEEFSRRQLFEDEITEKVEELESANKVLRTSNEELKKSSDELSRRLSVIESRENFEQPVSTPTFSEWQPSGTHQTKVLLIGDSNSAGKLKFGEGKGTLGKALPEVDRFCATVEGWGTIYPGTIYPGKIHPGTIYPGAIPPGTIYPGTIYPGLN